MRALLRRECGTDSVGRSAWRGMRGKSGSGIHSELEMSTANVGRCGGHQHSAPIDRPTSILPRLLASSTGILSCFFFDFLLVPQHKFNALDLSPHRLPAGTVRSDRLPPRRSWRARPEQCTDDHVRLASTTSTLGPASDRDTCPFFVVSGPDVGRPRSCSRRTRPIDAFPPGM